MYADQILGLNFDAGIEQKTLTTQMKELLDARSIARSEKRWADSDDLRVQLEDLGLIIKDTPEGQTWSYPLAAHIERLQRHNDCNDNCNEADV